MIVVPSRRSTSAASTFMATSHAPLAKPQANSAEHEQQPVRRQAGPGDAERAEHRRAEDDGPHPEPLHERAGGGQREHRADGGGQQA